jgi:hypothetical protein
MGVRRARDSGVFDPLPELRGRALAQMAPRAVVAHHGLRVISVDNLSYHVRGVRPVSSGCHVE